MPGPSRRCLPFPLSPSLVILLLVLGTPACSSSFARLFLRRQPSTPRLRGSDNGELALSSWFIASFDCQVHAAESVHPPSFPRPPRFSPPPCPAARLPLSSTVVPLFTALSCPPPGGLVGSPSGSHYSWKWKLRWSLLVIVPPAWMAATRCFQRFQRRRCFPLPLPSPPFASYAVIFPR